MVMGALLMRVSIPTITSLRDCQTAARRVIDIFIR
jgi:hypothetical protein